MIKVVLYGHIVDFIKIYDLMSCELIEALEPIESNMSCDQEYLDAYCDMHLSTYGIEFLA